MCSTATRESPPLTPFANRYLTAVALGQQSVFAGKRLGSGRVFRCVARATWIVSSVSLARTAVV